MRDWILAARPKTLPASLAPVWVGSWLGASCAGVLRWDLAAWTLAGCLCLQIATNLFNDAIDFRKGADTARRLGPDRVTAQGRLSPGQVIGGALALLGLAVVCGAVLFRERGWLVVAIGLPSLYLCYGYSGGPLPLAYRGLGELFVFLFFGLIAVAGSAFVQSGAWPADAWIAGAQTGLLSTALIAVNNLRDIEEDRASGKRTLAVRFGLRFGRLEILFLIAGCYLAGLLWLAADRPRAFWLPVAALPLGIVVARGVWAQAPGRIYNRFLALSALQLLVFALLLAATFSAGPR
ncbi:MAG TPA: 1,4-dihydroxy-2-naphthoate octaprenyltransferase [Verrucomicrobiales bacterium]|nr:1,4-dihydroxy-2-naphthoate octaprenyltransferase [Verrucomicrobiales bacterium]